MLDEARNFFTFVNVDAEPVPSLLRGFSAPVTLVDGLGDAELLVLLGHDTDPFNRWEAAQRLGLSRLLAAVQRGTEVALDAAYVEAMRDVLRHPALDAAFKELVLTLPSEGYVAEQLEAHDPQRIHAVREAMLRATGPARCARLGSRAYEANQVGGGYTPDPVSSGRRALASLALAMLCLDAVAPAAGTVWPGKPTSASRMPAT